MSNAFLGNTSGVLQVFGRGEEGKIRGKQKGSENLLPKERDVGTGFVEREGRGAAVGGRR